MATLTKTAFEAKYTDNTTGLFKDNTTQDIGADDLRTFADDIADSFTYSGNLNFTVVQIGDWDMDSNIRVNISHGLDASKIRTVSVLIRNDDNNAWYPLGVSSNNGADLDLYFPDEVGGGSPQQCIDSDSILLERTTGGKFDSPSFNATSYNRGWITIGYVD